jgi:hypothetical protein
MSNGLRGWTIPAVTLAGVMMLAAVAGAAPRADEDFHWSWSLAAGKAIEIKGINGSIEALPATDGKVDVGATRHARKSDPSQVTIEVLEHAGGITLCVKYPAPPGKTNVCAPGEGGHMNTRDNDVKVDFKVRVPKGVRFIARTVNGDIEARDLASPVEAVTVNGSVEVATSASGKASTVNGSIRARLGSAAPGPLEFVTVNGTIDLTLPAAASAELEASTVNGEIESDFPVTMRGRIGRHHLSGVIAKGGPHLHLETVNGNITLHSASS